MNVSEQVALYPIFAVIFILIFGIFSFFSTTEISTRVNIVASVSTSVTLLFLMYERLTESARRKLDYLNKKALTNALGIGKGSIQSANDISAKILGQCKELLEHNGRFLGVKLYPKNLVTTLGKAKVAVDAYVKLYDRITLAGYASLGQQTFNIWAVLVNLGFMEKGNYTTTILDPHRVFFESLKEKDAEAYREFPTKGKAVLSVQREIVEKIEKFFTANQLEEFREQSTFARYGWS